MTTNQLRNHHFPFFGAVLICIKIQKYKWRFSLIVWLSSYPRSGNTFLRLLCWRVFGIDNSTVYLPEDKMKGCLNKMGTVYFKDGKELKEAWVEDSKPHLVKTHTARNAEEVKGIAPNGRTICMVQGNCRQGLSESSCSQSFRHRQ